MELHPHLLTSDDLDAPEAFTLLDLLDRILDKGVVIRGDLTLSVANVDLVYVGLKVLLGSMDAVERMRAAALKPLPAPTWNDPMWEDEALVSTTVAKP